MTFVRVARVWKRILAFLLDLYLSIMVFSAFLIVIESELPHNIDQLVNAGLSPLAMAAVLYASLFVLLYHVFCEYIIGQTAGMMLFGVYVQPEKKKQPLRFWQALVRNLFLLPFFPFTLLWIIEPVYYVFQGERLLERWTDTQTVEH